MCYIKYGKIFFFSFGFLFDNNNQILLENNKKYYKFKNYKIIRQQKKTI